MVICDTIWFLFQIISVFLFFVFNEYQGNLLNIHFKLLRNIMYFKYHSNWKEVYVANSSPFFGTLNDVYSSAFNTWPRLESHSDCLSNSVIIKPNKCQITCEGSCTIYIPNMQTWWELILIKLSCQSFISTGYQYRQMYLAIAEFPGIKLKIRDCLQYCKSIQHLFYIKISQILLHPKHFCCMFWSFTPFQIPCVVHDSQGWGEYYSGTRLVQNSKHEYTKNIVLEYYSSTDFQYSYSYVQYSPQPWW